MVLYRRNRVPGGTYFFTAVCLINGWRTKLVVSLSRIGIMQPYLVALERHEPN